MADDKKCTSDNDQPKAVDADNIDDEDGFLDEIVTRMRPFTDCHLHPYLYEPNLDKSERKTNPSTEQVHYSTVPVAFIGELLSNSVETTAASVAIQDISAPENQTQQEVRTFSEGIYQAFPISSERCDNSNVGLYAQLTTSTEPSPIATSVSYTSLIKQTADSYIDVSTPSGSKANGNDDAYNYSLSDSNAYNDTLPHSTEYSDTLQLPGDNITRAAIEIGRSFERRSEVELGHYSTLDPRDCDRAMSGIYDSIADIRYQTVCTTNPASTKQQHEQKARDMAELEAAKRKTMTPFNDIALKTSMNEAY